MIDGSVNDQAEGRDGCRSTKRMIGIQQEDARSIRLFRASHRSQRMLHFGAVPEQVTGLLWVNNAVIKA